MSSQEILIIGKLQLFHESRTKWILIRMNTTHFSLELMLFSLSFFLSPFLLTVACSHISQPSHICEYNVWRTNTRYFICTMCTVVLKRVVHNTYSICIKLENLFSPHTDCSRSLFTRCRHTVAYTYIHSHSSIALIHKHNPKANLWIIRLS